MKRVSQLIVFIFCVVTLFTGCDQQMTKPIMEVMTPSDPPIDPSSPTHIDRARAAMLRVNQRRTESKEKAAGDYMTVFTDSETIFNEELGFRKGFWVELVDIYKDENADNTEVTNGFNELQDAFAKRLAENTLGMFYFQYIRTFDPLIIEYLRLSYVYPTQSEAALLARFRKSVSDGRVSIIFPEDF